MVCVQSPSRPNQVGGVPSPARSTSSGSTRAVAGANARSSSRASSIASFSAPSSRSSNRCSTRDSTITRSASGPGRDRLHALASATKLLGEDQRKVWVTEDVQDAFLNVPLPRLLQIVKKYVHAEDLTQFIGKVLGNASTSGLRQGGSLSPLLLNLYLHHHLDKPWRREHPDVPLIRVADDILLLCRTVEEARHARASCSRG